MAQPASAWARFQEAEARMLARLKRWFLLNRMGLLIFCSMAGLYFFTNFQRVGAPGTVFDEVQSDFHATASQVTALSSVFLYVYACMQVFIGAGADRFGPAKMMLAGGALLAVGSVLFPLSHTLTALYICRAIVGLGASFMYLSIIKEIVNIFEPRHFAPMLGILLVLGYSGGLVATAPLERLVAHAGWRNAFLLAGVICAVLYVFVAVLLKKTNHIEHDHSSLSRNSVRSLFCTRGIYPLLVCAPINFALYYMLQITIGKKFLQDRCGLTSAGASDVMFAMMLIVIVGYFVGGFLPSLAGRRRKPFVIATSVGVLLGAAGLAVGMLHGLGASWFVGCYLLLAFTNTTTIAGTTLLKEISPRGAGAFAIGVSNAASYISVAVCSNAAGLVLDAFKDMAVETATATVYPAAAYQWMFVGMVLLAVVSLAASLFSPETRGVQREEQPAADVVQPVVAAESGD